MSRHTSHCTRSLQAGLCSSAQPGSRCSRCPSSGAGALLAELIFVLGLLSCIPSVRGPLSLPILAFPISHEIMESLSDSPSSAFPGGLCCVQLDASLLKPAHLSTTLVPSLWGGRRPWILAEGSFPQWEWIVNHQSRAAVGE